VLIAYADIGGPPNTLQSQILAEPGVIAVDLFDAFSGTPTLAQLTPYNIVVAFSNNAYNDAVGMGNVLADYADIGGIVVGLNFDWFGPPFGLAGRWITGGYTPFNTGPTNFATSCLGTYDTSHPLMQGISAGSLCAFFRHTLTLSSGAVSVAMYQDNQQLCAYKTNNGHTGVGINAYLGQNPMNFSGLFGRVIVNAGRWLISGPCGTPSPTPTATATPTGSPSCTPSAWQNRANMPTDLYGAAGASNGTFFYAAGGYSFSLNQTLAVVNRFDPVANSWTAMASMPQAAIMATAVYYPPTNKIYVFGGEDAALGTNYNITRIYDIATNTWSTGANMPDVHSFAAGGYIPATGKIYIISGYNTGQVTSAQPNTWAYDPVANTWTDLTATVPFPHPAGGAGFGVINNKLYIAGGRDAANLVINLTWEWDPVAGTYTAKTDEPGSFQNNVPGSGAASGLLWVFGGGNPFSGANATKAGLTSGDVPSKLAFPWSLFSRGEAPDTSNAGRFYNPATNSWTSSPNMNTVRSFTSGGAIGSSLLIAAGGYNGTTTVATAETEGICGGGTPTPTPTGSPSATPTATPTATPGCSWSPGPALPSVGVRLVGVYFPANGKFYAMGGRASDAAGSEFTHPFEYDPGTNSWTTKSATYPDTHTNNMACGVLTDAGTPYIYCVGGSQVTVVGTFDRVFRYNPVTDVISAVAAPWPGGLGMVLPGGFTVLNNKLYILGGFDTITGGGQGTSQIWEFTPPTTWVQKPTVLPVPLGYIPTTTIGSLIYTGGGSNITAGVLTDTTNSFVYNPGANTIGPIAPIPRATGETRALNFNGKMLVMGGGRTAPNPSNEVDAYTPGTNTWAVNSPVPAFNTARRNFPTDTNGTDHIWLAGGYDSTGLPTASMEIFACAQGTPTPTPTATATATHTPTATPTATATATHTPTATPTATATATHTPTATPTATATATHTPTATPTATPTSSPPPTPTAPPRSTPTPRPRPTPPPRP